MFPISMTVNAFDSDLIQALEIIHQKKLEQFPEPNPSVFANLLDTHMGFAP